MNTNKLYAKKRTFIFYYMFLQKNLQNQNKTMKHGALTNSHGDFKHISNTEVWYKPGSELCFMNKIWKIVRKLTLLL